MHEKQVRRTRSDAQLRTRTLRALPAVLALASLAACAGDSLYEAGVPSAPPPDVVITRPGAGQQVLAGRPLRVHVSASDTLGVSAITLSVSGVTSTSFDFSFVPPRTAVAVDTVVVLPPGATGSLNLRASARNALGAIGAAPAVGLTVTATDLVVPTVALEILSAPPRMELTDSVQVRITAQDNDGGSGIVRLGLSVLVTSSLRTDTLVLERLTVLPSPQHSPVSRDILFAPPFVMIADLPRNMTFEFHAFAVDSAGNCAGAVNATGQRLPCTIFRDISGDHTIAAGIAQKATSRVVAGRSVSVAPGSVIADAIADVPRSRLYLSNFSQNRVEVLRLDTYRFGPSVSVGSEPWGVELNRDGDTLIVANSGGTSVSYVASLSTDPREVLSKRFRTRNTPLFEIGLSPPWDSVGIIVHDFSDRPQFIAQDSEGRLIFSTVPTAAQDRGTLRRSFIQPGWEQPELYFVFGPDAFNLGGSVAFANVDSARIFRADTIVIYDHRSGFPNQVISSGKQPNAMAAIQVLASNPDSDIWYWPQRTFDFSKITFQDTTFVGRSEGRHRVIFGEGAAQNGRILLWKSADTAISNEIRVSDLVGNGSEHILDVMLSSDGTLGIARGTNGAYSFKNDDLRLEGFTRPGQAASRSGAVLHPDHPEYIGFGGPPASSATTVAFVDAGQLVRIVDTTHFGPRGEIEVRDNIIGPLRISRPLPGDNVGCSGVECLVAKLYAVTDAGAVVVVNVRAGDIR